jgi:hypothetical protein
MRRDTKKKKPRTGEDQAIEANNMEDSIKGKAYKQQGLRSRTHT